MRVSAELRDIFGMRVLLLVISTYLSCYLNNYKILFVLTFAGVFSETANRIVTYDIPADSAWNVDGYRPTLKSIMSLCQWFSGQDPIGAWYDRNLCLASIWQIIWRLVKNVYGTLKLTICINSKFCL